MGSWGTGIFQNDVSEEVRTDYRNKLKLGKSDEEALKELLDDSQEYLKEDVVTYAISFNGKARYNLEIPADTPREEIEKMVLNHESSVRWLEGKTPKKIIVVPNKIVNIVI